MPQLSDNEQEVIRLARQFEGLRLNPAWTKLRAAMGVFTADALDDIQQCRSSNAQVRSNLLTRYEQRKAMLEFVDGYLSNISEARKQLIRDLAETNGIYGAQAEDVLDSLAIQQEIQ